MNTIIKKVVVACSIAIGVMATAIAGSPIVDLTKQIRDAGGAITVTPSSINSDNPDDAANVVDGNDGTSLQFKTFGSEWLELELPASLQDPIYVTSIKLTWGHLNSCCRNTTIFVWDDEASDWVLVASENIEGAVWDSTIQLPGDKVKHCRKFRIELLKKVNWAYVIKEIYLYGRTGVANPPLGKVIVQSENSDVVSSLSHTLGEHLYVPKYPTEQDTFTAEKTVEIEDAIIPCLGYVLETSTDWGANWSEPVTNLNAYTYNYKSQEDVVQRITWIYGAARSKVTGNYYLDNGSGLDQDGNYHASSFEALVDVLQNNKTIFLGTGTFVLPNEVVFNGLKNITIQGAGKDNTFIEPAANSNNRCFSILHCNGLQFKDMTFRNADVSATDNVFGGVFYVSESTGVEWKNCVFTNNKLSTTKNVASGSAITAASSTILVNDCVFERNTVVAPRALGGAITVLALPNLAAGSIACTNTTFRKNMIEGSNNARGLAVSFGGNAGGEFVNCLAVMNRCRSKDAIGTGVFASNAYLADNTRGQYTGTIYSNGQSNEIFLRNSTIAYNQANAVVTAGNGSATIENCVIRGQRSVVDRFNWYMVTMNNTFYDNSITAGVTFNNCSQENPLMGYDFRLASGSPATGHGYTFTGESTLAPKTIYVDPAAAVGGNGTQGSPFKSLTAALGAVGTGDTIILAAGMYTPETETFPILIEDTDFVTIRGAGAGETIFSNNNDEEGVLAIRVKDNVGLVMRDFSVENNRNIEVTNDPSAIDILGGVRNQLLNVTVKGCERLPSVDFHVTAGHVNIRNVQGMIVSGLRIEDSIARIKGGAGKLGAGAFSMLGTIGLVENSAFIGNGSAGNEIDGLAFKTCGGVSHEGGMYGDSDTVGCVLHRNLLVANNELLSGSVFRNGDIFYNDPSLFENCTFIGTLNAKIFSWNSAYTFKNCIIKNVKGFNAVSGGKLFTLKNCVVVTDEENTEAEFSALLHADTMNVTYTTNAGFKNEAAKKYTLKSDSPAVNAGENLEWMTAPAVPLAMNVDWRDFDGALDFAGKARISGKIVDAGCYEYQQQRGFIVIVK